MRPVSKEQWQDAVDAADFLSRIETAEFLLRMEMGRLFGLVDNDYEVDIQSCLDILEDGRKQGVTSKIRAREGSFRDFDH
jgi:hypothetical protein